MRGPSTPLPPALLELLPQWVARQRWYTGQGRVPVLRPIGGVRLRDPAAEAVIEIHLLRDESGQAHTTYQVPLTTRTAPLAGFEHALVAVLEPEAADPGGGGAASNSDGTRYIYDAPHDPAFAAGLLRLMMKEETAASYRQEGPGYGQGCEASGHRLAKDDPGQVLASRVLSGEQSNTSIIIDLVDTLGGPSEPLICKLFRVLHPGQNPDVVVQSALSAAGSSRVPSSVGYVSGTWPDPGVTTDAGAAAATRNAGDGVAAGHLAFAQEFLPGVEDAWRVAQAAVASGTDFTEQARSLGEATAQVHETLAEAMGTSQATERDILELTRRMRARHDAARSEVPELAAYDQMIRATIDAVSSASWPALQRIHGDYHLGQVLNVPGRGWVLVDFEGEPLRPLEERTKPDLALRDVAGMLRSFDYAAGAFEREHPDPTAAQTTGTQEWATRARTAFLEGYTTGAGRDPREDAVLLDALELDKALYEVVYEARHRPTWLGIPTTAIGRLVRTPRAAPPREVPPSPKATSPKATLSAGPRSDLPS